MFENILGHELFLCDRGVFIIGREACMQRKRDISIYFLPVACYAPLGDHVSCLYEGGLDFIRRGQGPSPEDMILNICYIAR